MWTTPCSIVCFGQFIKSLSQPPWRQGLFGFQVTLHYRGKPGEKLKVGTKDTMGKHYLLAWFSRVYSLAFLLSSGTPCPGQHHAVSWVLPHQLSIYKMPHRYTQRPIWWRQLLGGELRFSLPRYVKETTKVSHHRYVRSIFLSNVLMCNVCHVKK